MLAVLVFVMAVYTKQTSITAPAAVLFVAFATDRRSAFRAYGLGLLVGSSILLLLTWLTGGGFIRHLLFYNLNRFSLASAVASVFEEWPQALFLALALGGLLAGWRGKTPDRRRLLVLTLWLGFATAMLATLGKSGAKLNYMIDWMCIWSVLIGILVTSVLGSLLASEPASVWSSRSMLALLVPVALLAQVSVMPTARDYYGTDPEQRRQLVALAARLKTIPGPVLSDDMVLLIKSGKPVPWEPAIFAELASDRPVGRAADHRHDQGPSLRLRDHTRPGRRRDVRQPLHTGGRPGDPRRLSAHRATSRTNVAFSAGFVIRRRRSLSAR